MARFLYTFHGGKRPESPQEGERVMAEWGAWMQGLGTAIVDPGGPAGNSKTVTAKGVDDDGGANPVSGHTIIEAGSMDAAVDMARGCPILDEGTVEITEVLSM